MRPRNSRDAAHAESLQNSDQHLAPGAVKVDQPLGAPLDVHFLRQLRVGRGDAARTAPSAFAPAAPHTAQRHQFRRPDDHAVRAQGDGLGDIVGRAYSAAGDQRHLVADALVREEIVHLADGVFDGHGDILLGDVRRRAGPAVAAVNVDDMRAGGVAAHRHHIHVRRRRYLRRDQGPPVDVLYPVDVLHVVFDGIDAVERERREQRYAQHRLAHLGHGRGVLVAQQMAAQAGLGALGILEFHDRHALNRFLAHAEKARGDLRDHVVVIGPHPFHVAAFARAGEGVARHRRPGLRQLRDVADRSERHAAAVPGNINFDFGPAIVALVQRDARVNLVFVEFDRRLIGEFEPEPVEAAAGIAAFVIVTVFRRRHVAGFGHFPRRQNQIRRPAIIAQRLDTWDFPGSAAPLAGTGPRNNARSFRRPGRCTSDGSARRNICSRVCARERRTDRPRRICRSVCSPGCDGRCTWQSRCDSGTARV